MGNDRIDQHTAYTEQCKAAEIPEYVSAEFTCEKMIGSFGCGVLEL
jgi:hypothetical protein